MFITIEGIDGTGKSTQSIKLAECLEAKTGRKTIRTAEPYILREFILGNKNLCAQSDLLLFLADRAEHVNKIIIPALNANENIICERYNDSTLVYQVDTELAKELIAACKFPEPDVKILLDIDPEIAFSRVLSRNNHNDKFEAEGLALMKRVSENYRELYSSNEGIVIACDDLDEGQVFERIIECLQFR